MTKSPINIRFHHKSLHKEPALQAVSVIKNTNSNGSQNLAQNIFKKTSLIPRERLGSDGVNAALNGASPRLVF